MVGVPGRSNACTTCKARKKGCDRQKPHCGQCVRLGIPCEGYEKVRIFVNSGPDKSASSEPGFVPASYETVPDGKTSTRNRARKPLTVRVPEISPASGELLARTALYSQYLDSFWATLLPNGQIFSKPASGYSHAGWSMPIQQLCQQSGLVRLTLLANALGVLGQQNGQQPTIVEGLRTYGTVLQIFARSLPANDEANIDKLLATSMLLGQYELLQGAGSWRTTFASGQRWLGHTLGSEAIILAKRPEYFSAGIAHQLFINCRLHLTTSHLRNRKCSPLSSPEWKSIPWSKIPKDPKNELIDILVEIPAVLEDIDNLADNGPDLGHTQTQLLQSLIERCWLYDSWLQQWSSVSGSATVRFVETLVAGEGRDSTNPSTEDFAMAHLGLLYWTTCLLLYQNLCNISTHNVENLPERMEPRQYCRKIMLLMSYFQHPNVGEFFINIVSFPAICVMRFVERHDSPDEMSEECNLLLTVFKGKFQRRMENFLGGWPWRFEYHKRLRQQLLRSPPPASTSRLA